MPRCRTATAVAAALLITLTVACSPHKMGVNRMASAVAASSAVYESDNDPEFVRLAAPGTLKMVEMLLVESPDHPQLLLTACRGFTEYSYAFLQVESQLRAADENSAAELRRRATTMYKRARGYCIRGLRVRHRTLTESDLTSNPRQVLQSVTVEDVPLLYWLAAGWGSELSLAGDSIKRLGELASVRALLGRARELDDRWEDGAIYEALIVLDALPSLLGGSHEAARTDFKRAIELSNGRSVFAYVAMAGATPDPAERRTLLQQAVAIDVNQLEKRRLINLIAQRYARALLAN